MRKLSALVATLLPLLLAGPAAPPAAQERRGIQAQHVAPPRRVALVIGNNAYAAAPLRNAVNDARAVAQALRELGFEVLYEENLSQEGMKRAVRSFGQKARGRGVRLFYYAGHGMQVSGENYLIPVDASFSRESEVEYETVNAGLVLAQMEEADDSVNVVILDACRNNPFARGFRSAARGLAAISAPSGTLIAYATAPGSVAADGDGGNGLYTQELLRHMRTPDLSVEEIFKQVRIGVRARTGGRQTPWESSSLTGAFYFAGGGAAPAPAPPRREPADASALELSFWDSVKNSSDPEDFRAYLEQYPRGSFAALARRRIQSLEARPASAGDAPAPRKPPSAPHVVKSNFFTFALQRCRVSGTTAVCDLLITNDEEGDRELAFGRGSELVDDLGSRVSFDSMQIANAYPYNHALLVPGLPVKAWISFGPVSPQATAAKLVKLTFRPRDERSPAWFEVTFRDVPFTR